MTCQSTYPCPLRTYGWSILGIETTGRECPEVNINCFGLMLKSGGWGWIALKEIVPLSESSGNSPTPVKKQLHTEAPESIDPEPKRSTGNRLAFGAGSTLHWRHERNVSNCIAPLMCNTVVIWDLLALCYNDAADMPISAFSCLYKFIWMKQRLQIDEIKAIFFVNHFLRVFRYSIFFLFALSAVGHPAFRVSF